MPEPNDVIINGQFGIQLPSGVSVEPEYPTAEGIERCMFWLDRVAEQHGWTTKYSSDPLIGGSGFNWKRHNGDSLENFIPVDSAPFGLVGYPIYARGFWENFREIIEFAGDKTLRHYDLGGGVESNRTTLNTSGWKWNSDEMGHRWKRYDKCHEYYTLYDSGLNSYINKDEASLTRHMVPHGKMEYEDYNQYRPDLTSGRLSWYTGVGYRGGSRSLSQAFVSSSGSGGASGPNAVLPNGFITENTYYTDTDVAAAFTAIAASSDVPWGEFGSVGGPQWLFTGHHLFNDLVTPNSARYNSCDFHIEIRHATQFANANLIYNPFPGDSFCLNGTWLFTLGAVDFRPFYGSFSPELVTPGAVPAIKTFAEITALLPGISMSRLYSPFLGPFCSDGGTLGNRGNTPTEDWPLHINYTLNPADGSISSYFIENCEPYVSGYSLGETHYLQVQAHESFTFTYTYCSRKPFWQSGIPVYNYHQNDTSHTLRSFTGFTPNDSLDVSFTGRVQAAAGNADANYSSKNQPIYQHDSDMTGLYNDSWPSGEYYTFTTSSTVDSGINTFTDVSTHGSKQLVYGWVTPTYTGAPTASYDPLSLANVGDLVVNSLKLGQFGVLYTLPTTNSEITSGSPSAFFPVHPVTVGSSGFPDSIYSSMQGIVDMEPSGDILYFALIHSPFDTCLTTAISEPIPSSIHLLKQGVLTFDGTLISNSPEVIVYDNLGNPFDWAGARFDDTLNITYNYQRYNIMHAASFIDKRLYKGKLIKHSAYITDGAVVMSGLGLHTSYGAVNSGENKYVNVISPYTVFSNTYGFFRMHSDTTMYTS